MSETTAKFITIRPDHFDQVRQKTHVLYRCFNRKDLLLYIGMTNHPEKRFEQHRSDKAWWKFVNRITLQHFPSRRLLSEAEAAAIELENPKFNIQLPSGAISELRPGRRSVPLWSEPSRFGTVVPDYEYLIEQTLEQQLYPCVECHARAIQCEGDTVSCQMCASEWDFESWFAMTFPQKDTPNGGK